MLPAGEVDDPDRAETALISPTAMVSGRDGALYVLDAGKLPWYIDLLNVNLGTQQLGEARKRIQLLTETFRKDGTRITENLDFAVSL